MPIAPPINQIWVAYNHLPGGQMVATHFEDVKRTKKVGDGQEEILFSAKDQLANFKKSDFVALFANGKLMKHEVLVYAGADLSRNPKAADVVLDWARGQGMKPYATEKKAEPAGLEARVAALEGSLSQITGKIDELIRAVSKKE